MTFFFVDPPLSIRVETGTYCSVLLYIICCKNTKETRTKLYAVENKGDRFTLCTLFHDYIYI